MGTALKQGGFTIVETMVVLGITGTLFLTAFLTIDGKQSSTEFYQSIHDIQSVISQTISEVNTGYYANTNNFLCNGTGGTIQISSGTNSQGANNGCIFIGKAMQFGVNGTSPEQYIIYTIVGLQGSINNLSSTLSAAKPTALAPGASTNTTPSPFPDASQIGKLNYGLTVASMNSVDASGTKTPIGTMAFISSLGNFSGSQLQSGSLQTNLMPVSGSALKNSTKGAVDNINNNLATSLVNPANGIQICFASAGTIQSGLITIGGGGRIGSSTLTIYGTKDCT
jgi:type II secretory pathway pseudopilin PulG